MPKKNDFCKCRYKNCFHPGEPLLKKDAVKDGNSYYHKDCYKAREDIKKILKIYEERVDQHPIYSALVKIVNEIIFKNGTESDFLLFALEKATEPGSTWHLRRPPGLYYLAKDEKLKRLWLDYKKSLKPKASFEVLEESTVLSGYVPEQQKRLGNFMD